MRRYSVTIAGKTLELSVKSDGEDFVVEINGRQRQVSVVDINPRRAHFLIDSLSREVDLRKDQDRWTVFIEGRQYDVDVVDYHLAELRKTAGVTHAAQMPKELKAPMPGMVLKIDVSPGDEVKKGDTLLVLEAMKMENLIKATGDGAVKRVIVSPQTSVEKGQPLIEFA